MRLFPVNGIGGLTGIGRCVFLMPVIILAMMMLEGCYYVQAVRGHMDLMHRRQPLGKVLSDPTVDQNLKERLTLVQEAREFAVQELLLPDNDSYRSYADLGRDYVVWNVFAAPEFSLQPEQWCFPVAGCVAYRGYFSQEAAREKAAALERDGYDVAVLGVSAYSTLGRFDDPVLNTMLRWSDTQLVATLFHELAHQVLYVKGDTRFNESFATSVSEIGMQRWLSEYGGEAVLAGYRENGRLQNLILDEIDAAKGELTELYAMDLPAGKKRARKKARFEQLSDDLASLMASAAPGQPVNLPAPRHNADLVSLALYEGWGAAFSSLYAECERALDCFYRRAREIADLPTEERNVYLVRLQEH